MESISFKSEQEIALETSTPHQLTIDGQFPFQVCEIPSNAVLTRLTVARCLFLLTFSLLCR